jgi:hypothetical protein
MMLATGMRISVCGYMGGVLVPKRFKATELESGKKAVKADMVVALTR